MLGLHFLSTTTMVWTIDLSGKTIVVTGGNRGIGYAISRQVAKAGAHVAIFYRSSEDAPAVAEKLAAEYGVKVKAYKVDVTDVELVHKTVFDVFREMGPIGGLVANAGSVNGKPALELTHEDFTQMMDANVWGVFTCCQAVAALWKEHAYKNGRIVIVSSIAGQVANRGATIAFYNTSKASFILVSSLISPPAAVTMLAKTLAMEWANQGILVNTVSPGFVHTEMNANLRTDEAAHDRIADANVLKRVSEPDEQAGMAVYLLSGHASYITGADHTIDGGHTIW